MSEDRKDKLPFLQLYVADYLRDTRHLSLSARGAWSDILFAMHTAQIRGRVRFTKIKLARFLGATTEQVDAVLGEIRDPDNVTGRPVCDYADVGDGVFELSSRRMLRDEIKRAKCAEAGRKGGGNPALRSPIKGAFKPDSKPPLNPESETESDVGEVSPNPSGAGGKAAVDTAASKPVEQAKPRTPRPPATPMPEIPEPIDTPEFRRAWEAYLVHRGNAKFKVTPNAAVIMLGRCVRWGVEASIKSIEDSIAAGWRGLVEPRYSGANHGNPNRSGPRYSEPQQPTRSLPKLLPPGQATTAGPLPRAG